MKKYYISSKAGLSGICKYSFDFYELVLKEKNYIWIDSSESLTSILTRILSKDHIHFEIGIFQKKEIKIMMAMLDAGYKNIAVTLHDPPLLKFPFYGFNNSFANKVSKFYDLHINNLSKSGKYINKIKTIYVLSRTGAETLSLKYQAKNIFVLPHVVNEKEVVKSTSKNNDFIYFGFIGRNKGIEYSLQLHQQLLVKKS